MLLKKRFRSLLFLAAVFTWFPAFAQKDSIAAHQNFWRWTGEHIVFNFDARYSFITGQQVHIDGAKLGLQWRHKWRTGVGVYFLSSQLHREVHPQPRDTSTVNA